MDLVDASLCLLPARAALVSASRSEVLVEACAEDGSANGGGGPPFTSTAAVSLWLKLRGGK